MNFREINYGKSGNLFCNNHEYNVVNLAWYLRIQKIRTCHILHFRNHGEINDIGLYMYIKLLQLPEFRQ